MNTELKHLTKSTAITPEISRASRNLIEAIEVIEIPFMPKMQFSRVIRILKLPCSVLPHPDCQNDILATQALSPPRVPPFTHVRLALVEICSSSCQVPLSYEPLARLWTLLPLTRSFIHLRDLVGITFKMSYNFHRAGSGLNKNRPPSSPLLKQVPGGSRQIPDDKSETPQEKEPVKHSPEPTKDVEEAPSETESWRRSPDSTSNDEEDLPKLASQRHYDTSDSENDGRTSRGDITMTIFESAPESKAQKDTAGPKGKGKQSTAEKGNGQPTRRSNRQSKIGTTAANTKRRVSNGDEDEDMDSTGSRPSKKAKSNGKADKGLGSHMEQDPMTTKPNRKLKHTFSAKSKWKARLDSDSPEKQGFFVPDSGLESPETGRTKFGDIKDISVAATPSSHTKTKLKGLDADALRSTPRLNYTSRARRSLRGKLDESSEEVSQKADFKMPVGHDDLLGGDLAMDMSLMDSPTRKAKDPNAAVCPMCDEPVDKQWLSKFSKNQRMDIRQQRKFCRIHKKKSAQENWKSKGLPEIDWDTFESRIVEHHEFLKSLVEGQSSHFGELLRQKIKTGKNRTLLKTDDYLSPGYYGPWGARVMTDSIIKKFSSLLRERAPMDRLISGRGYTAFVQLVLVPELAVRLIKEDMAIDEDEARELMEETRAIGDLLNDDKGDVVSKDEEVDDFGNPIAKKDSSDSGSPISLKAQEVDNSSSELSSLDGLSD